MSRCYNKNAAEYKALKEEFKNDASINSIISNWQKFSKTDDIPTVDQAKQMVKDSKVLFSLKQREFGEALLSNLSRNRLIHKSDKQGGGFYYVNNTDQANFTQGKNDEIIEKNKIKIARYLDKNNIPIESISYSKTSNGNFRIIVNKDIFSATDLLPKNRSQAGSHTNDILAHMVRLFPGVKYSAVSVSEAETIYANIPSYEKRKVPFSQVNSFYYDGRAYLIKGRVNHETAIEEVMHAFTDALAIGNTELFDALLVESGKNFPELKQQIDDAYNNSSSRAGRNFSQKDRDLELVTQALTRHFDKEYELNPTKSFLQKVAEVLEWLGTVVQDLHRFIFIDKNITLEVADIKPTASLSDVAKLLNTESLKFSLERPEDSRVRYSLSENKQKGVDDVSKKATPLQKQLIKNLFNVVSSKKETADSLSAGKAEIAEGNPVVILNKKNNKYYSMYDLTKQYKSSTEYIFGKKQNEKQAALKNDVGQDFDTIVNGLVSQKSFESIKDSLSTLTEEQAFKAHKEIGEHIIRIRKDGDVILPNVVLHSSKIDGENIATTADLLLVTKEGKVKIAKIKLNQSTDITPSSASYDDSLNTASDSVLNSKFNLKKLSTKVQDSIDVKLALRMLENMGYEVEDSNQAASVFYITLNSSRGKWNGEFKIENPLYFEFGTQNDMVVNAILPLVINTSEASKIMEERKKSDSHFIMEDADFKDAQESSDPNSLVDEFPDPTYERLYKGLEEYATSLATRTEVLKQVKDSISMDKSKEDTIDRLNLDLTMIISALRSNDDEKALGTYTDVLRSAIREVESLEKYLIEFEDKDDPLYISRARNAVKFASTFEGLNMSFDEGLTEAQVKLKDKLFSSLNRLVGSNRVDDQGIAYEAVLNHVKSQVQKLSNRELTDEDFDALFKQVKDITGVNYLTGDITASSDTLLAIMKKIWSQTNQKALDKIGQREEALLAAGRYLKKLSPGKSDKELYEFMIETDENGEHTGRYVQAIGKQYWDTFEKLKSEVTDENGDTLEYREVLDAKDPASAEDVAFNKALYVKKQAWSNFLSAEKVVEGKYVDGDYSKYTQEWKDLRGKYQEFIKVGDGGFWTFKAGVSELEQQAFTLKNFNSVPYNKPEIVDGVFTGRPTKAVGSFPLKKFTEIKEEAIGPDGKKIDMRSPKYKAIMENADQDALGEARKNYYLTVKEYYENGMLKQLPQHVRDYMLGKTPRVKATLGRELLENANVSKFLSKTKTSVQDFFTETTRLSRVNTDENGELIDSLPIMFIGSLRDEEKLKQIQDQIKTLKENYSANPNSNSDQYDKELKALKSKEIALRSKPKAEELSWDITSTMIKFSAMAQKYETMESIENTLLAFVKVAEKRKYKTPESSNVKKIVSKKISSALNLEKSDKEQEALIDGKDSNVYKAANAFMKMVFYDTAEVSKGLFEKSVDKLISYGSLSYVAFNVFGNFNNYALGRVNNNIEMLGQRYVSKQAILRARKEYNKMLPALIKKSAKVKGRYDEEKPSSKYEALAELFRMMDEASDIRETTSSNKDRKSLLDKGKGFGYLLQDAAEYNVQTTMGMAVLMDTYILNERSGEVLSLFDAYTFSEGNGKVTLKEGFTTIVKTQKEIPTFKNVIKGSLNKKDESGNLIYIKDKQFNDTFRYDTRMKIREINKQIHGNYAYEDRMVIQVHTWGKLLTQFKKWVMPAVRARYQKEYFDENLGWMEGRYRSWWQFQKYVYRNLGSLFSSKESMIESFMKSKGFKGDNSQIDEKFMNKALNIHRTNAEAVILISVFAAINLLDAIWESDDDDSETVKKLKNLSRYQLTRVQDELALFIPVVGMKDALAFFESPFATTRVLGEFGDVIDKSLSLGKGAALYGITGNDEYWKDNKNVYYQRGRRAGQLKMQKEIMDVVPILYEIKKWDDLIQNNNFFIKK